MERQYKKSYKMYSAWNYQKEIEDLNEASRKGWQLIKCGCFSSKFKKNQDVCYRYQLDFQTGVEDMGRYIETFREQGWEYVDSTFNGWHYFRKIYDPSLPEEQYEIFTDRSSMQEMNRRWGKVAMVLSVLLAIFAVTELVFYIMEPRLHTLIQLITIIVELIVMARGAFIMSNPGRSKNRKGDGVLLAIFFGVLIIGNGSAICLQSNRLFFNTVYSADEVEAIPAELENALCWQTLEVKYGDNYFMDLSITADSPVCFSILDDAGEVVYQAEEAVLSEEDKRLYLARGEYSIYISDYAGGKLDIWCDID